MLDLNLLKAALLKSSLLISLVAFVHIVNAHNPNSAFFDIKEQEDSIKIEVEFPWSLRNSLELFNSKLNESNSSKNLRKSLFYYIQGNLILTGTNNDKFELLSVEDIKEKGEHSHQSNFKLTYSGKNLNTIKNTIMFNISKKQVNSHSFSSKSHFLKFDTTPDNDSFTLNTPKESNLNLKSWLIGLLALAALALGLVFLKNRNR